MKNNKTIFKSLMLLALVVTLTMGYETTSLAIGKKIKSSEYRGECVINLAAADDVDNVRVADDEQSLVIEKPVLELRNESDIYVKYGIDYKVVGNEDKTLSYILEFEIYNLKNDKLIGVRTVYDTPEYYSNGGHRDDNGMYLLYKAEHPETGKPVKNYIKIDSNTDEVLTPYYIRMRATATDTVTGLTGTSEWSDNIYYVPEGGAGGIRTLSKNKIKVSSAKLKVKGVKIKDYNFYIKVDPRGKGKSTYYVFQMKNKKYSKTITKLGKHKINTVKNEYTVTAVPRIKHKGKTKIVEAYVLSSDSSWIPY